MSDQETFNFLGLAFDVTRAKELVRDRPGPSTTINPHDWRQFLSRHTEDGKLYPGITVNDEHARIVDLSEPVIVAIVAFPSGTVSPFIIDGWHRVARAWREGVDELPAHVLNESETKQVQL